MVDLNKIKERLDAQSNKKGNKQSKFKDNLFFKPEGPGKYIFRAVAYPHNEEGDSAPFAEKHYHFNIPGNYAVYCPEKNDGQECVICRLCWDHMKRLKGNNGPEMELWRERLPQLQVLVPGKEVGHFDENEVYIESKDASVKFLKFRSSFEKDREGKSKMSENHKKLYSFFSKDVAWQDWKNGRNLELIYETPKEGQKMRFTTSAMLARGGLELGWEKSKGFENALDFDEFIKTVPNLDEHETWKKKSSEDVVAILEKWEKSASEKAQKLMSETKISSKSSENDVIIESEESSDIVVEKKEAAPVPNVTKASKLEERLKKIGFNS